MTSEEKAVIEAALAWDSSGSGAQVRALELACDALRESREPIDPSWIPMDRESVISALGRMKANDVWYLAHATTRETA